MINKYFRKTLISLSITISLLFLSACSGHPSAGEWLASENNASNLVKMKIHYDGKADIFTKQNPEKALLHCFWQASNADTIGLICTKAENTDKKIHYQLKIDKDQSILSQESTTIAKFTRKSR